MASCGQLPPLSARKTSQTATCPPLHPLLAPHPCRQRQARRQEHAGPVDGVEAEDVLADDVKAGGPAVLLQALGTRGGAFRQQTTEVACVEEGGSVRGWRHEGGGQPCCCRLSGLVGAPSGSRPLR